MATYPDQYTKLLLHFNGVDASQTIVEVGGKVFTANANAQLDTAQKKFALSSLLLDGFDDYISTPNHADFAIGMSEFAVDFHHRFSSLPETYQIDYFCGHGDAGGNRWGFYLYNNGTKYDLYFVVWEGETAIITVGATGLTLAIDTWYHFAVTASEEGAGRRFRIFLDGDIVVPGGGIYSTEEIPTITGPFRIGTQFGEENFLSGWMDEFRFSIGTNRWADNFSVPTAEYSYTADFSSAPFSMELSVAIDVNPLEGILSFSDFIVNELAYDFASGPLVLTGSLISDDPFIPTYGHIVFPSLQVSGYARATVNIGEIIFPKFQVDGKASSGYIGTGSIYFPTFVVTGRFGLRGQIDFPSLQVSGQAKTGRALRGVIEFPVFVVSGQGTTERAGTGLIEFPLFQISGQGTQHFLGRGEINFKPFNVLGFAYSGNLAKGSIIFPKFVVSGKAYFVAQGQGDIVFPTFVVNGYARASVRERLVLTMNKSNKAVTNYLNFGFNSFASIGGVFYATSDAGIWKLDGHKDNGSIINARMLTGQFDFWVNGKKKAREVYLTFRADGRMVIEVVIQESDIWEDELPAFLETIDEAKSTIAKGIKERFLAFGIKNKEGADFEIDSMRVLVDKIGKVR